MLNFMKMTKKNKIAFQFVFILLAASLNSSGQINFDKGYIIDNENNRTECAIKNYDWNNNPKSIEYRLSDTDKPITGSLETVKEFGIYNECRFIRAKVNIDRSPDETNQLTTDRKPNWSQEQIFLKIIIEGTATLFIYQEEMFKRFFYSVHDSIPQQLVYKRYLSKSNSIIDNTEDFIATNAEFRQQLWNNVKCGNSTLNSLKYMGYTQSELERYFEKFNRCSGDTIIKKAHIKKDFFNFRIKPGVNIASVTVTSNYSQATLNLGSNRNLNLGLDAEFILPYNKNKWGIIIEPTYQSYTSSKEFGIFDFNVDYHSIAFPVGIRYYLFLKNKKKLFLNGFFISNINLDLNSSVSFGTYNLEVAPGVCYAFGGGITYKKLSAEVLYYTTQNLTHDQMDYITEFSRLGFKIGYLLF